MELEIQILASDRNKHMLGSNRFILFEHITNMHAFPATKKVKAN